MIRPINKDVLLLRRPSVPATRADVPVADDLLDTLRANADRCVGMAANMIGARTRVIVFENGGKISFAASGASKHMTFSITNSGISAADTVLILEHFDVVCGAFLFEVLFIDSELAVTDAAAACQNSINIFLRDSKSGGLIALRFFNPILLFFYRGERFMRSFLV